LLLQLQLLQAGSSSSSMVFTQAGPVLALQLDLMDSALQQHPVQTSSSSSSMLLTPAG
jgi:hypothetical protein